MNRIIRLHGFEAFSRSQKGLAKIHMSALVDEVVELRKRDYRSQPRTILSRYSRQTGEP